MWLADILFLVTGMKYGADMQYFYLCFENFCLNNLLKAKRSSGYASKNTDFTLDIPDLVIRVMILLRKSSRVKRLSLQRINQWNKV